MQPLTQLLSLSLLALLLSDADAGILTPRTPHFNDTRTYRNIFNRPESNFSNPSNSGYYSSSSGSGGNCANNLTIAYSTGVQFNTLTGISVQNLWQQSSQSATSGQEPIFVCSFTGIVGEGMSVDYDIQTIGGAGSKVTGRVFHLGTGAVGAICVVTVKVNTSSGCHQRQQHWNTMLLMPASDTVGDFASLFGSESWLSDKSLSIRSDSDELQKFSVHSVTCSVSMATAKRQFAQLQLTADSADVDESALSLPTFSKEAGGVVTQRLQLKFNATKSQSSFNCTAFDSLRQQQAVAKLSLSVLSGVSSVQIVDAADGKSVRQSSITRNDSITCNADVAHPKVTYSWSVMWAGAKKIIQGQTLNLTNVNIFFPICCKAINRFKAKIYSAKRCVDLRGRVTMKKAAMYNKPGRKNTTLHCPSHSKLGLMEVRYSRLKCSTAEASRGNYFMYRNLTQCDTAACSSKTAKEQIEGMCSRGGSSSWCRVDTSLMMEQFVLEALRAKDYIDPSCFETAGATTKIEVHYYCTMPKEFTFKATGTGRSGRIQKFRVPRSGCYEIVASGAAGGNHTTKYGIKGGGTWFGGRGATVSARFMINRWRTLSVVVGQHGGNSSEMSKSRNGSIEDNAGTGGGGGSFVYSGRTLYVAAGGGGGASYGLNGVPGQDGRNGADSRGPKAIHRGRGGVRGRAGYTNIRSASYHGGSGAGWLSAGTRRAGPAHGGHGSNARGGWLGGLAGRDNPSAVGGFGGGGGGSEDNGASGAGGGYSGGGAGTRTQQAGGGGGSYCNTRSPRNCSAVAAANPNADGVVKFYLIGPSCQ